MIRSITIPIIVLLFATAASAIAQERYTYDGAGRISSVRYSDGTTTTYTYDANSNILSMRSGISGVTAETRAVASIAAHPNPTRGAIEIAITVERPVRMRIDLVRSDGEIGTAVQSWSTMTGSTVVRWEADTDLPVGTYLLRSRSIDEAGRVSDATTNLVYLGSE
jgi:YD repeat-containing protein